MSRDFQDCSYGFGAGRSPHQALTELGEQCLGKPINWIMDADISGFFD
jgi:retron-type reverse transcriptase